MPNDEIGTKKLFENDRVAVWEVRLDPGQQGALHEHQHDYVLVQIEGDRVAADISAEAKGAKSAFAGQRLEGDVYPGKVIFVQKGSVETAVNIGAEPFYEILIELKD